MESKKIVLLATEADTTNILYHKIEDAFGVYKIILEQKIPSINNLRRRTKKQGAVTVAGQVLFKLIAEPVLKIASANRVQQILSENQLNTSSIPANKIIKVESINSEETISLLQQLNPDLMIMHGTRILSSKLLQNVSCKIMNIHAGITPKYRGVHGAYWALAESDPINCGVTVHFVDEGIDTGEIILQDNIQPSPGDNFHTYPYLQLAKGIELLLKAVKDHFENRLTTKKASGQSVLRHHPTIWTYIYNRFKKIR